MKELHMPTSVRLTREIESGLDRLEWEYSVAQHAVDIRAGHRQTVPSDEVRRALGLEG